MLRISTVVAATSLPNFRAAQLNLPSNLHSAAWNKLVRTPKDAMVVEFLRFRFPAGYKGPVHTTATDNHPSACNHTNDIASYISTEVRQGPWHARPI